MKQNTLSKTKQLIELGTFEMVSGVARISDPCYDKKAWCAGKLTNLLNGTWKAQVIKKEEKYEYTGKVEKWAKGKTFTSNHNVLIAVHESFDKSKVTIERSKIHGGMDAGMAGIFDDKFYKKNYKEDYIKLGEREYSARQDEWRRQDNPFYREFTEKELIDISLMSIRSCLASAERSLEENKDKDYYKKYIKDDERKIREYKARLAAYKADPNPEHLIERTRDWYEICCDKSLSNIGAGVIRNGVVSSSGYGDGGYDVKVAKQDGKIVGVKLIF